MLEIDRFPGSEEISDDLQAIDDPAPVFSRHSPKTLTV
jgi:hypothetical protein